MEKNIAKTMKEIEKYFLQGLSWEEMKLKGITDTDRKKYYGFVYGKSLNSNSLLVEEKAKLRIAKKELSIIRQQLNENVKYLTEYRLIQDAKKKLVNVKLNFGKDIKEEENYYILTLADLHYSGNRKELKVLEKVGDEIVNFIKSKKLKELIIAELGDTIEGASLRPSQLFAIKSGMINQALEVAYAYKEMLEYIIKETKVKLTYIGIDSSNHTQLRTNGTKRNELPEEDLMIVINDIITKHTKGLHNYITGDEIITDIKGFIHHFSHGHTIKNKTTFMEKVSQRLNKQIDFGHYAHYHHLLVIDLFRRKKGKREYDVKCLFSPSLKKETTQYEKDLNMSSCAGIGVYEFNKKNGNVSSGKIIV